jgi:hypothetical protein
MVHQAHVARAERGADRDGRHRVLVLVVDLLLDRHARVERSRRRGEQSHEPVTEAFDEDRSVGGGYGPQELLMPPEIVVG